MHEPNPLTQYQIAAQLLETLEACFCLLCPADAWPTPSVEAAVRDGHRLCREFRDGPEPPALTAALELLLGQWKQVGGLLADCR